MNLSIACQWQEPAPKDDPRVDVAMRDDQPWPTNKRCGKVLQFDHVTVPWSRPGMGETFPVAFIVTDDNEFIVKRLSEIRPCQ